MKDLKLADCLPEPNKKAVVIIKYQSSEWEMNFDKPEKPIWKLIFITLLWYSDSNSINFDSKNSENCFKILEWEPSQRVLTIELKKPAEETLNQS